MLQSLGSLLLRDTGFTIGIESPLEKGATTHLGPQVPTTTKTSFGIVQSLRGEVVLGMQKLLLFRIQKEEMQILNVLAKRVDIDA
eukprot:1993363-Pyramimonas_sp.AAC.1